MQTAQVTGSDADLVPNRAAGYRLLDGRIANQERVSPTLNRTADGTLYFGVPSCQVGGGRVHACLGQLGKLAGHDEFAQALADVVVQLTAVGKVSRVTVRRR